MKLVIIFGPQASGKMTVGQELARRTDLKLFHNHMTIDLVAPFFNYGSKEGKRLVNLFRKEIFETFAACDQYGLIFTYVWAFDQKEDMQYIKRLHRLFTSKGAEVYYVELEVGLEERLIRNKTENRLLHKPTKRDVSFTEKDILYSTKNHRLNSMPGEIEHKNYLRISGDNYSAEKAARMIQERFGL